MWVYYYISYINNNNDFIVFINGKFRNQQQFQSAFSSLLSLEMCATLSSQRLTLIKIQSEQMSDQPSSSSLTKDIQQRETLAYVLHTSGTTGRPKIVKVPHRCIMPNIIHLR